MTDLSPDVQAEIEALDKAILADGKVEPIELATRMTKIKTLLEAGRITKEQAKREMTEGTADLISADQRYAHIMGYLSIALNVFLITLIVLR